MPIAWVALCQEKNWLTARVLLIFITMLLQELQVPSPLENEQKLFDEQLLESVHAFESVVCATVVDDVVVVVAGLVAKTEELVVVTDVVVPDWPPNIEVEPPKTDGVAGALEVEVFPK